MEKLTAIVSVCLWEVKNAVSVCVCLLLGVSNYGCILIQQEFDSIGLEPYLRWLYAFEIKTICIYLISKVNLSTAGYLSQTSKAILLLLLAR